MFKKVLFIGAHTDDECCCAGTLSRFIEEKKEVYVATFSFCEKDSIELGFSPNILKSEFNCSVEILGMNKNNIFSKNYPVRHFPTYRQQILDDLVKIQKKIEPDLVLIPSSTDTHQDHKVIFEESIRAFQYCSVFGYETPKNLLPKKHSCFIKLKRKHFQIKTKCRSCYKSQQKRVGINDKIKLILSKIRGAQINCEYAEVYQVLCLKI